MRYGDTAPRVPTRLTDEHIRQVYKPRRRWNPRKLVVNVLTALATLFVALIFGLIFWAGVARADVGHPELYVANELAKVVHSEARGEPWDGKVAVAAVVLNRVRDPRYPATVKGVINQPGQFVSRGGTRPSPECVAAARAALNGQDPTGGALYFYADWSTCTWIRTRPVVAQIGNHVFAR